MRMFAAKRRCTPSRLWLTCQISFDLQARERPHVFLSFEMTEDSSGGKVPEGGGEGINHMGKSMGRDSRVRSGESTCIMGGECGNLIGRTRLRSLH